MATQAQRDKRKELLQDLGLAYTDEACLEARNTFLARLNDFMSNFPRDAKGATNEEKMLSACAGFVHSGVGQEIFGNGRVREGKPPLFYREDWKTYA